jgi:branched-chain amino acid aminotransferase
MALNLDWANLGFEYFHTPYKVRSFFRNGKWEKLETFTDDYIPIHIAATVLHYGQEAFEGLKAYRGKDGKVRLFRWQENAKRLQASARRLMMPEVPEELFHEAITTVVKLNEEFIPPYGYGATLYIRPLLIGTGARVGVHPADEYMFLVFVIPAGSYFKGGFKTQDFLIIRKYDRAAPLGTGNVKAGGNYAAGMIATEEAQEKGFANALFLDPKEKKYIDEAGPANFFGIKNKTYITPKSTSILPSITNKSLMQLSEYLGYKVEHRPIAVEELETLEEAGACGNAAVITPIRKIVDEETGKEYIISKDGEPGPISTELYKTLTGIQFGEIDDPFGWTEVVIE